MAVHTVCAKLLAMALQQACLNEKSMALVVELHPDIKELQQDVLWCLIPLDQAICSK